MTDPAEPEPARAAFLAPGGSPAERALAVSLQLPLVEIPDRRFPLLVTRSPDGALEVRWSGGPTRPGQSGPRPLRVDFSRGPTAGRLRTSRPDQPLARAVGVRLGWGQVLDATAGLGRDAMTLAVLGCEVTAVERQPVLAALLRDGLRRGREDPALRPAARRVTLVEGDARDLLRELSGDRLPDTVYLDPMYPATGRAAVKKESQLLRALAEAGGEAELLELARNRARHRVAVKRHPHAPPLGDEPDAVVRATRVRYDVYLTR